MNITSNRPQANAPDMLICTRFGLRVRERAWLEHRLKLISAITAPSLLAQQDQSFTWVLLVDDGLPDDIRGELKEILHPFGDWAVLCQRTIHTSQALVEVAVDRGISGRSPYLLTARIDDDDRQNYADQCRKQKTDDHFVQRDPRVVEVERPACHR